MKVSEAISQLQRYHAPEDEITMSTFDVEDVDTRCEERGITLTDEQKRAVLREMDHGFDSTYGLNWDAMDTAIDAVAPNAPKANAD